MGQISSAPVELIRVQRHGGADWRGAVAEMQGWRSDHEDAHFMVEDATGALFGVLDGHGGSQAARLAVRDEAKDALPSLLRSAVAAADGTLRDLERRVAEAFVACDAWLRYQPEVVRDQSGSTCVVAGLRKRADGAFSAFVANAGDSRGILVRRSPSGNAAGEHLVASEDHKPDRPDEHARIAAAGGFVSDADAARNPASNVVARLDGNLAVSRGLGDFAYKQLKNKPPEVQKVSCVPEFYELGHSAASPPMQAGDLLILACDGIFDVLSNEALAEAVADARARPDFDAGATCAAIVGACLRDLHSKDNMTLMIVEIGVDGRGSRGRRGDYDYDGGGKGGEGRLCAKSDGVTLHT